MKLLTSTIDITGNAATATILQNARTIGGVSFNGSANIVPQTIQSINEATDTTCFPLFITASGTQSLQPLNNAGLIYNSSANTLTATTFIGALTGTASGNLVSGGALGTPSSGVATNLTGLVLTSGVTGVLPVANGGTNANSASITAFNNITGYTAAGATGTTSTNLVFSTSPALTTPTVVTSLVGGATFALCNTTTTTLNFAGAATTLNIGASATCILNFGGSTTASEFRFLEPSGSGTNYSAFKAVAQSASITYSLPPTVGASGTVLTDAAGDGVLTWAAAGGAGDITTVGNVTSGAAFDGTAGTTLTGTTAGLTLTTATAGSPGGPIAVTGGTGNTNQVGGSVTITSGAGNGTGINGEIQILGGAAGASANAASAVINIQAAAGIGGRNGGPITIVAGNSGTTATTAGGAVSISAGNGNAAAATNGGAINLTGGNAADAGTGGGVNITSGNGGTTGNANDVTITGGAGGSTSGNSGSITIQSGTVVAGVTGNVTIKTRDAAGTNKAAGNINLVLGVPTGSGTKPTMKLRQPSDNATALVVEITQASASITASDTFIDFWSSAESGIGSIAGSAVDGVVAYNTFTGSHYTHVIGDTSKLEPGSLLEIVESKIERKDWIGQSYTEEIDEEYIENGETKFRKKEVEKVRTGSLKEQLFKTQICTTRASKSAVGAWGGKDKEGRDFCLSIGTGVVFVANKGKNVEIGDFLISSDVTGATELQDDDIYRNISVAKATENIVWGVGETKRRISCIYLGG